MPLPTFVRWWQADKARQLRNETDAGAAMMGACCSLLLAALARDRATLPLMACHALLCWAVVALNRYAPSFCIQHRDLLAAAMHMHHSWTLAVAGLGRDYTHISFRGMHPLFLWPLTFLVNNGSLWMVAYTMRACLPWHLACVLLPAVVAAPLWHSPATCRRLIDSGPGFQAALARLHRWAGIAHSPLPVLLTVDGAAGTDAPLLQCIHLNTHALLLCNVALPLLMLWRAEQRSLRRLAAQQRRAAQLELLADDGLGRVALPPAERVQEVLRELDERVHWPLGKAVRDAQLASTAVWLLVVAGTLLRQQ